ncbi:hypothetical protein K435DRAFT_820836 [Dendrothele bispora CBS 962.96]|uniref:CxC2-like cysteine cluster KDZ transposase-associated domain-containing protein n=1 Tax=Dendrothele bispora (strain CBS 962.96) TaxID=1314807 RepID=A0A4S8LQ44_DENBC|nr:hypothetical protein K435DRAFT_820836 [Dendrothele bispora CBS 962.96]
MWGRKVIARSKHSSGLQKVSLSNLNSQPAVPTVVSQSLSTDGRRVKKTHIPVNEPPSPVKKRLRTAPEVPVLDQLTNLDFGDAFETVFARLYDDEELADAAEVTSSTIVTVEEVQTRRRYLTTDQPLKEWIPYRDEYLAEFIRLEGRGDFDSECCPFCKSGDLEEHPVLYRCLDCFGGDLVCRECCVKSHTENPLHIIEKWSGNCFDEVSLKSLGLCVQLGHRYGETCTDQRFIKRFTVMHVNGMHEVNVAFCNCDKLRAGEWRQQLLRRHWYPGTHLDPHTCATFELLNHFHLMTLQGKVNAYDYYNGLEKLRNNAGLLKITDRFKAFARMIREWRHIKMLKRGGRGNDGTRPIELTEVGELGVPCIACPRVGVNLPPDWQHVIKEQYKYWLYLAIDACFRLKRRIVSSKTRDPSLGSGWAYFVEGEPFRKFLLEVTDQNEMCTCSGLAALEQANTKFSRGYATTGVGLGVCARHEFVQKNAVVDLQKGERYANMDYGLASLLRHHDHRLKKVISYDIVCQWCKNLIERLKKLPPLVRLQLIFQVVYFVIPKLHIYGHQVLCQLLFSLNWLWAHMGPVATSTRDMGPGSRHDTLDDHWGHWNFVKMVGLGTLLLRRLLTALAERSIHCRALKEFTEQQGEVTNDWMGMIQEWEAELALPVDRRTKKNLFEMPKSGLSEAEIKLQLTELEAEQERKGIPAIHNVSPTSFVSQGLELEEHQRTLKLDIQEKKFDTTVQKTALIQRRTKLLPTYIPGALQLLSKTPAESEAPELPEDIPLYLPSDLPSTYRREGCRQGLLEIEQKLREAQLRSALNQLRNHLHMKSRLLTYRTSNVAHQGAVTRSKALFNRCQRQIKNATRKYQRAWIGMTNIVGEGEMVWKKLEEQDVRLMDGGGDRAIGVARKQKGKKYQRRNGTDRIEPDNDEESETEELAQERTHAERLKDVRNMIGEGTREVSWIWTESGTGKAIDDEILQDIIRVEWCKAYSRAKRWEEEVILVKEEMRRCLVTLEYNAVQWDGRQGVRAYAYSQAAVYRDLASVFRRLWEGVREDEKDIEEGQVMRKEYHAEDPESGAEDEDEPAGEVEVDLVVLDGDDDV